MDARSVAGCEYAPLAVSQALSLWLQGYTMGSRIGIFQKPFFIATSNMLRRCRSCRTEQAPLQWEDRAKHSAHGVVPSNESSGSNQLWVYVCVCVKVVLAKRYSVSFSWLLCIQIYPLTGFFFGRKNGLLYAASVQLLSVDSIFIPFSQFRNGSSFVLLLASMFPKIPSVHKIKNLNKTTAESVLASGW